MSLKPVKRSRRRSNRYPRLETSGNWNFSWRPVKRFDPVKYKRLILSFFILGILGFGIVWASDPSNPLFHSQASNPLYHGGNDPDVVTPLWSANGANGVSEWNFNHGLVLGSGVQQGSAGFLWAGSQEIVLNSNTTGSNGYAVVVSKTGFDLSSVSGKHLKFIDFFEVSSGSLHLNQEMDMFLTRNATVAVQPNWNPETDPNVVLNFRFINIRTDGGGFDYGSNIMLQINPSDPTDTIAKEDTGVCGSGDGSCFLSSAILYSNGAYNPTALTQEAFWLNFTGNSANGAGSCQATIGGGPGCSVDITTQAGVIRADSGAGTTTQPQLKFQGINYYLGYYLQPVAAGSTTIAIGLNSGMGGMPNQIDPTGSLIATGSTQIGVAQIISVTVTIAPTIDTGGFFGPVIKALISIGVFILNAILGFIGFLAPALQAALNFLEGILVSALNGLGNALGLGNVGTTLQTFINSVITFFTSGQFGNIILNFPTAISRLIDVLTVYFPWLAQAILIGAQVATFLVKGVGFTITILGYATSIGIGASATFLIVLFFVYTGDNSLGGVLEFWQTTLWLVVGLGLKFLTYLVNFILDVVTALIGVIPKPLIQMVAHQLPRLPLVNTEASFVSPSGLMGEIRNGNLFAVALWISGLLFTDLYESATPALPGSIGALAPSAANALKPLVGLTPLLEIMTVFVWMAALFVVPIGWLANAMDFGNLPFESSLGSRPQTHFGVSVSRAQKHNVKGSLSAFRQAFRRSKPSTPAQVGENIN